jgi:hypothetical protein
MSLCCHFVMSPCLVHRYPDIFHSLWLWVATLWDPGRWTLWSYDAGCLYGLPWGKIVTFVYENGSFLFNCYSAFSIVCQSNMWLLNLCFWSNSTKWNSDTLLMLWMHIGTPSEWWPCHNAIRLPQVFSFWFQLNSRPVSWLHDVAMHINCFSANFILGASKKFHLNTLLITDRIASFWGLGYIIFPFKGVTVHWNRITVWSFLIATLSNTLCHPC